MVGGMADTPSVWAIRAPPIGLAFRATADRNF